MATASSIASPNSVATGSSSTSIPRTTRPAARPRRAAFATRPAEFSERDAVVWGVSPQGAASKAAFRAKYGLGFPLLIDADHAVADAYGSWVEKQQYGRTYMGVARRTFLIDADGRIAKTWEKVKPEGHPSEVLAVIDAVRAG